MKNENTKNFSLALKKLAKGRDLLCKSLTDIQSTPCLDKNDVDIISGEIDRLDSAIGRLKSSFDEKSEWYNG